MCLKESSKPQIKVVYICPTGAVFCNFLKVSSLVLVSNETKTVLKLADIFSTGTAV